MNTIPNTPITIDVYATALAAQLTALVATDPSRYTGVSSWDDLCDLYDGLLKDTDASLGYDVDLADLADFDGYAAIVVPAVDSVVAARFPI